jgi:tRNA A-37 threonylcarbamoyl transferase component Bud32
MHDSMVGQFLGQYELLALIGKGGMARVYKSIQLDLERYVAVKLLHPSVAADEEFQTRFRGEAKAAASLRHPHIVQIFDFGHQDEFYYMVMELIDGPTLRDELQRFKALDETLPFGEVQRVVGEVSEALDYAHDRRIIHRDVKPANILLTPEGQVVLSDFGLAYIIESPRQTITGFVGTPEYMSPEQSQGLSVDGRTDVYSLGVVIYEMLTGRVPFTAETPMAVVMKHISEPLPPPRSVNPDIPENVEHVLLKAMSKDPRGRYGRAGELSRALAEAFEAAAVVEAPTAVPAIPEEIPKVVEEPEEELRCARCGAVWSPGVRFCGVCGASVSERWQPPAPPPPVVTPPPTPPEPFVVTVEERPPERSKLSLMIAVLSAGLLAVIVLAVIVAVAALREKGPSIDKPTVAGVVGGTVISRASDTPSPTIAPTEAQPTATVAEISTPTTAPTASAPVSPTPIKATSTPTPTPARPAPTATATPTTKPASKPTQPPAITSYENMIVFKSDREGGEALYVMNPDGSDQSRLDDESVYYNALALEIISPDGKWRLEVREIEGNVDIWRVNVAGTPPDYRITSNTAIDQEAAWAPIDQNRIAFVSTRTDNTDIWTQNVNEPLDEKQLTDNPDYDKHPSWSPDGTQIVYWAVHQGGPRQIWVVNAADGSNKRNISNNDYNDWDPVWIKQP